MIQKIEEAFAGWEKREIEASPPPEVNYEFQKTVNLVQRDDVNQTNIFIGHIGGLRNDPDYFALVLVNRILGSGFTSRLFREVRSRQGLAYSVLATTLPIMIMKGSFTSLSDQIGDHGSGHSGLMAEVEKMAENEVTDEELELARRASSTPLFSTLIPRVKSSIV